MKSNLEFMKSAYPERYGCFAGVYYYCLKDWDPATGTYVENCAPDHRQYVNHWKAADTPCTNRLLEGSTNDCLVTPGTCYQMTSMNSGLWTYSECRYTYKPNDTECTVEDDSFYKNACVDTYKCYNGTCIMDTYKTCPSDECTTSHCDATTGECTEPEPKMICPSNQYDNNDFCNQEPACPACGDSYVSGEEECDDGNTEDGDGCAADCTLEDDSKCPLKDYPDRDQECASIGPDSYDKADADGLHHKYCDAECKLSECSDGKDNDDDASDDQPYGMSGYDQGDPGCFECSDCAIAAAKESGGITEYRKIADSDPLELKDGSENNDCGGEQVSWHWYDIFLSPGKFLASLIYPNPNRNERCTSIPIIPVGACRAMGGEYEVTGQGKNQKCTCGSGDSIKADSQTIGATEKVNNTRYVAMCIKTNLSYQTITKAQDPRTVPESIVPGCIEDASKLSSWNARDPYFKPRFNGSVENAAAFSECSCRASEQLTLTYIKAWVDRENEERGKLYEMYQQQRQTINPNDAAKLEKLDRAYQDAVRQLAARYRDARAPYFAWLQNYPYQNGGNNAFNFFGGVTENDSVVPGAQLLPQLMEFVPEELEEGEQKHSAKTLFGAYKNYLQQNPISNPYANEATIQGVIDLSANLCPAPPQPDFLKSDEDPEPPPIVPNDAIPLEPGFNEDDADRVNVVFVGVGYDKPDDIKSMANDVKTGLLSVQPWNALSDKVQFWIAPQTISKQDFGEHEPLTMDSAMSGRNIATTCATDIGAPGLNNVLKIVLCNVQSEYGQGSGPEATLWVSRSTSWAFATTTFLSHEVGHAFSGLADEYTWEGFPNRPTYPNCAPDQATAEQWWGGIGVTDSFEGCSYVPSNVRATKCGIMNSGCSVGTVDEDGTYDTEKYGKVGDTLAAYQLAFFAGGSTERDPKPETFAAKRARLQAEEDARQKENRRIAERMYQEYLDSLQIQHPESEQALEVTLELQNDGHYKVTRTNPRVVSGGVKPRIVPGGVSVGVQVGGTLYTQTASIEGSTMEPLMSETDKNPPVHFPEPPKKITVQIGLGDTPLSVVRDLAAHPEVIGVRECNNSDADSGNDCPAPMFNGKTLPTQLPPFPVRGEPPVQPEPYDSSSADASSDAGRQQSVSSAASQRSSVTVVPSSVVSLQSSKAPTASSQSSAVWIAQGSAMSAGVCPADMCGQGGADYCAQAGQQCANMQEIPCFRCVAVAGASSAASSAPAVAFASSALPSSLPWQPPVTVSSAQAVVPSPVCGDRVLGVGEQCDDGNRQNGDGCSAACTVEHAAAQQLPAQLIPAPNQPLTPSMLQPVYVQRAAAPATPSSGPATAAAIAAGAASGLAYMRRKKRKG